MKIPILIGAASAALLVIRAASAHIVVEPANSAVGEVVTYTVRVPSHLDARINCTRYN